VPLPALLLAALAVVFLGLAAPRAAQAQGEWWRPFGALAWDLQLTEPFDLARPVQMIGLDLFDTDAGTVARLKAKGIRTVCYLNAGAWEDWREDAGDFPPAVLGADYEGWPGEKRLDIRRIEDLAPLMLARMDMCKAKGFDAVQPDNIDGYINETGFPLSADDQLRYNRWLAAEAHKRGLSIGLKNDQDQARELVGDFDWAMTEDCFAQGWCEVMLPFILRGKSIFAVEYTDTGITTDKFCAQASVLGINAILKTRELDAWWEPCP